MARRGSPSLGAFCFFWLAAEDWAGWLFLRRPESTGPLSGPLSLPLGPPDTRPWTPAAVASDRARVNRATPPADRSCRRSPGLDTSAGYRHRRTPHPAEAFTATTPTTKGAASCGRRLLDLQRPRPHPGGPLVAAAEPETTRPLRQVPPWASQSGCARGA